MTSKYTPISNTDEEGGNGGGGGGVIITNFDETIHNNDDIDNEISRNEFNRIVDTNADENIEHHNDNEIISNALRQHDSNNNHSSSSSNERSHSRLYNQIFRQTFLTDDTIKLYGGIILIENTFAMKLFKFTIFTFLSIWTMFYFVRFMVRSYTYINIFFILYPIERLPNSHIVWFTSIPFVAVIVRDGKMM
jgi:hypothetical protein